MGLRLLLIGSAAAAALAAAAAGCGGDGGNAPAVLVDGSKPPPLPAQLEHLGDDAVMTRVRVVRPAGVASQVLESCLRDFRDVREARSVRTVVERLGVSGRSLTFWPKRALFGCDGASGQDQGERGPWCGGGFWAFQVRRLDPRTNLACRDAAGQEIAFAWVEPIAGARWLTVEQPGYHEVYPAAIYPVRITSYELSETRAGATFRIRYYDRDGQEIGRQIYGAGVAG